jgi:hypothetical protein
LDSPERSSAGEARKLQVWNAAIAACKAGQAMVLSWLFLSGRPAKVDACIPWHLWDVVKIEDGDTCIQFEVKIMIEEMLSCFGILNPDSACLISYLLFHNAILLPDTACLMALLEVGLYSKLICFMAVREGKAGFLDLAVDRGCPCDCFCLYRAAEMGHLSVLERLWSLLGLDCVYDHEEQPDSEKVAAIQGAAILAAKYGQTKCLQALLHWGGQYLDQEDVGLAAARGGHLSCLRALHKYVYPTCRYTVPTLYIELLSGFKH